MTKYRSHRLLLVESLETTVDVASFANLVAYMRSQVIDWYPENQLPTLDNTKVEKYGRGIDERCGWDTHIVTVNGQAWGFTDGPLENE